MRIILLVSILLATFITTSAADTGDLDPNLAPLKPFLGSWRGEFKRSTPENPLVDTALWERALNGKAIRILHSINDGTYGGETLMTWDDAKSPSSTITSPPPASRPKAPQESPAKKSNVTNSFPATPTAPPK